jgi:hypothetical protein
MIIDTKKPATTGSAPAALTEYRNQDRPSMGPDPLRGNTSGQGAIADWNALGKPTAPGKSS